MEGFDFLSKGNGICNPVIFWQQESFFLSPCFPPCLDTFLSNWVCCTPGWLEKWFLCRLNEWWWQEQGTSKEARNVVKIEAKIAEKGQRGLQNPFISKIARKKRQLWVWGECFAINTDCICLPISSSGNLQHGSPTPAFGPQTFIAQTLLPWPVHINCGWHSKPCP